MVSKLLQTLPSLVQKSNTKDFRINLPSNPSTVSYLTVQEHACKKLALLSTLLPKELGSAATRSGTPHQCDRPRPERAHKPNPSWSRSSKPTNLSSTSSSPSQPITPCMLDCFRHNTSKSYTGFISLGNPSFPKGVHFPPLFCYETRGKS